MAERELADFEPSSSHLHTCAATTSDDPCDLGCIHDLFAVAQDAEKALHELTSAPVLLVLHPGGRAVLTVAEGVPDYDLADYLRNLAHDVEAGRHRTPAAPPDEPTEGVPSGA